MDTDDHVPASLHPSVRSSRAEATGWLTSHRGHVSAPGSPPVAADRTEAAGRVTSHAASRLLHTRRRIHILAALLAMAVVLSGLGMSSPAVAGPLPAGVYTVAFHNADDIARTITDRGLDVSARYTAALDGVTARLTAAQATALARDPRVAGIAADVVVEGTAQTVPVAVRTVEADKAPVRAGDSTGTWTGPALAVVDSGVSPHSDLNLARGVDCTGTGSTADANGHGTGVSGFAAALDNGIGTVGVAPGAPLYSVRVLDSNNRGTLSTLLCGLNWVTANAARYGIKVLNLSLATAGADSPSCGRTSGDVLHQAICAVVAAGVTVVSSAGNSTKDLAGYVPGAYDEVLTATNVVDYDGRPGGLGSPPCAVTPPDDTAAPSSNFAVSAADKAHTLAAPGVCPYTTLKGNRYGIIQSGTSMSAAALSGVVLDCLAPGGACAGATSAARVREIVMAQAQASAARGHRYAGDPTSPVSGRYYGYLASTVPGGTTPTPTPTPTPSPTGGTDVTAPTVRITSPANGSTVTGTVTAQITATDNVAVTAVALYTGTTRLGPATRQTDGTWRFSLDTTRYPPGTYAITARATDAAANTATSPPVSLTVVR